MYWRVSAPSAEITEEKGDAPPDANGGEIDLADVIEPVPRPVREVGV